MKTVEMEEGEGQKMTGYWTGSLEAWQMIKIQNFFPLFIGK